MTRSPHPVVRIDRLSLRLPPGTAERAPTIARLMAAELSTTLAHRTPPPDWRPGPVHVASLAGDTDAAIASRAATRLTEGWR